jgi:putative addiction module component (TIGR02574 family)
VVSGFDLDFTREMGMDVFTTLAQIAASLPVDERICLVEAIWDTIAAEPNQPELTEAQKQEMERRLAAHAASPENVVSWEQVKAQALARARK